MTNAVDIENVSLVFGGEGNNPVLAVDTINIAIPKHVPSILSLGAAVDAHLA